MSVLVDMGDYDLNEISLVPRGMNPLADAPVTKEEEGSDLTTDSPAVSQPDSPAEKRLAAMLTSVTEGHQHGIHLRSWGDDTKVEVELRSAQGEGENSWHEHEIAQAADGSYVVSMSAGHTHEVDGGALASAAAAAASPVLKGDEEMTDNANPGADAAKEEVSLADIANMMKEGFEKIDGIEKRQDRTDKVMALSASDRSVFDQLSKEAQDSFLAGTEQDRTVLVAQATKAAAEQTLSGEPAYVAKDGTVLPAGTDPIVVELVKQREQTASAIEALTKANRNGDLEKQASEVLSFAPGNKEAKLALMDAVAKIGDENPELGKDVGSLLKGMNDAGVYNFSNQGTEALTYANGGGANADVMKQVAEARLVEQGILSEPMLELNKMAADYQAANPVDKDGTELTKGKAYQIMSATQKGRELVMSHYANTPVDVA